MNSSVMNVRVRSHVPCMLHWKSRLFMTGRLTPTSQVWFASVPAFCHWFVKPNDAGVGTFRIWLRVFVSALVTSTPRRSHSVTSVPSSISVVVSGLSSGFPAWPSEHPVVPQVYVSYCAEKLGVDPAVPRDARRRNSVTPGTLKKGSSDTRHTPEMRPNGAQRLPEPNSELPSYRNVPSRM